MKNKSYLSIAKHYEACFEQHGDSHKGMDWPNEADAEMRYRVMLDVIRPTKSKVNLLDYGCGASHLFQYMLSHKISGIEYAGLDVSEKLVAVSRSKFPALKFYQLDLLEEKLGEDFDYIVANGVFTEKRELSFDAMFSFMKESLTRLFPHARMGLAFNVMSKHVDWERDDLFHVPLDTMVSFLKENLSRHVVLRCDYGLYEYTVYVYREPMAGR